ncbi:MAG: type II toxin-antitoxin system ParD family antitoxin [Alphaproteobacteria bacterium]
MDVTLPSRLESFVEERVRSGDFESPDAVVAAGLRLLQRQEEIYQVKLERLRAAIAAGRESGVVEDFSMETLIAELDAEEVPA